MKLLVACTILALLGKFFKSSTLIQICFVTNHDYDSHSIYLSIINFMLIIPAFINQIAHQASSTHNARLSAIILMKTSLGTL